MAERHGSEGKPLVSIIVTSYNYGHYLAEAIESALSQSYQNTEIVVVDDGSTDNTKTVAALYPVKYVFQKHCGVSAARNTGIRLTHGEFFMSLDGDDKIFPNYLETTLKQMIKKQSTGFVYTGSRVWNEITELENIRMPRRILSKYSLFAGWMGAQGPMLIRRKAFESLDHGYDPNFPAHEDLDICFRLLSNGWKSDLIYEPLHWYRIHTGSLNPGTPERRRIAGLFMDRKFWFRKPYRRIFVFYQGTVGRIESLMRHPVEYLKGIQKKTRIKIEMNSFLWLDKANKQKTLQIQSELYSTIDMLVSWHQSRGLRRYYENRIEILEHRLKDMIMHLSGENINYSRN